MFCLTFYINILYLFNNNKSLFDLKTMINKLTLNNKIFKAYQLQGNVNELIARLETNIDESINDPSRLSEIVKNIPGGNLINILQADSSFLPTC